MMDGKIRAVRSSGAGMYHGLHKQDMNEEAKESISGSDFLNEKHAEEIWKAHLAGKHRITIEEQEIFLHSIGNRARLVICGGGHVSTALVRMAKLLDFEIWVLEDRPFLQNMQNRREQITFFVEIMWKVLQKSRKMWIIIMSA